jgi:hypothetical protein
VCRLRDELAEVARIGATSEPEAGEGARRER